jgi:hypothetical protein
MDSAISLKDLEKKAFRAAHQDGLWDIYIGLIILSMSVMTLSDTTGSSRFLHYGIFLLGLGVAYLIFWGGKKYLTTPRLGQVKFGPRRQRRKMTMVIVLSIIVLLQLVLVIGTMLLRINPQFAADLGFTHSDGERLLVAIVGALFVGPSIILITYFNDFPRGYYIALLTGAAVFSLIWFSQPAYLIAAALLIIIPGVLLLIRFLRKYPLPPAKVPYE